MTGSDIDLQVSPRPRLIVWSAWLFAVVVFSDSCWRWWTFQYETFDLAFYVQALWLALRGHWMVSLLNVPLLGNHAEPIVFLAAPIFAVVSHPMLLVALQTAAMASLPFTAWRITQCLGLERRSALLLSLSTLLAPATGCVALHEFHPEALAAPFLLLLIEARMVRRLGRYWLWFVAVLACKENLALLLIGFSAVHALMDWNRAAARAWQISWNLLPLGLALLWVGLYAKILGPALNGGNVDYLELYSHLGKSGSEILCNFFLEPSRALHALERALRNGNLLWALLLPFLGLPLLRPRWLLIAAPILFQHLLSWRSSEWSISFHYAAPLLPLFWIATAEALSRFRSRGQPVAALVLVGCGIGQFWGGPFWGLERDVTNARAMWWSRDWKAKMLAQIPAEASVTAGLPYLSHLATRERLVSLHHILKGLKTLSRKEFKPESPTDVVLVDYADGATFSAQSGYYHPAMKTVDGLIVPASDALLYSYMQPVAWRQCSMNSMSVYSQGIQASASSLSVNSESEQIINPSSKLQGLELKSVKGSNALAFRLNWAFSDTRQSFSWMRLELSNEAHRYIVTKGLCGLGANSASYSEVLSVSLPPDLPPGRYRLALLFWDNSVINWANIDPARPPALTGVELEVGGYEVTP